MKATQSNTRRIQVLIGLLLALGLPFCHLGDLGRSYSGLGPLFGGDVLWWILFSAIVLYVLFVEHKSLSSIGFHRPRHMGHRARHSRRHFDVHWGRDDLQVRVAGASHER